MQQRGSYYSPKADVAATWGGHFAAQSVASATPGVSSAAAAITGDSLPCIQRQLTCLPGGTFPGGGGTAAATAG